MRHIWPYFRQSARQQFSCDISSERSCLTWQSSLKCHMKCGPNCLILLHPCKRILVRITNQVSWHMYILASVIAIQDRFETWLEPLPASIATLAQRWPNVNPYVGPTSAHRRWAKRDLSIGPMLAQQWSANVGPTLHQHRPNIGTLALDRCWRNVTPMVVCQRCTNIGPMAFLIMGCDLNGCMFGCVDQENISW